MTELGWHDVVTPANREEALLLPPLLLLLRRRRWINEDALVLTEFAWNGRRIDLVTLTATGRMSAFELKIGSFGRALEQSIYNRLSFGRSWVVTDGVPKASSLAEASENGVGVMSLGGAPRILVWATRQDTSRAIYHRLHSRLKGEV